MDGQIPEIDIEELAALLEGDIVLVDVRQPDEHLEARVPGVQSIPLPELAERHTEIPQADTVYVICKVGGRSMRACEFLTGQGRAAVNIAGGTDAWIGSGRSVESGPAVG